MHKVLIPLGVIIGIIIILYLDHLSNHGYSYDEKDFKNAFYNIAKSHEGLIVALLLIALGLIVGVSI